MQGNQSWQKLKKTDASYKSIIGQMVLFKCKEVVWVGWKRINADGQMGGEPINKTTMFNFTHKIEF